MIKLDQFYKAGYSPIPIAKNKIPLISWKNAQGAALPKDEIAKVFRENKLAKGVGVVTGAVSGNLECLDFDLKYDLTGDLYQRYINILLEKDRALYAKIVKIKTQSNGYHWIYKLEETSAVPPSHAIAKRYGLPGEDQEVLVLIETRGEGGYFATVPTEGYELVEGDLFLPPVLTSDERQTLMDIALRFNEVPDLVKVSSEKEQTLYDLSQQDTNDPLTDFNVRGDSLSLLIAKGWSVVSEDDAMIYLKRPGFSTSKTSGKIFKDTGVFYVHSTSTSFEAGKGYNRAAVFAHLECNDSYSRARLKLAEMGYGNLNKLKEENTDPYVFYSNREYGLADWIRHLQKDQSIAYFSKLNELYVWKNSRWQKLSDSEFLYIIHAAFDTIITTLSQIKVEHASNLARLKKEKEKDIEQIELTKNLYSVCEAAYKSATMYVSRENIKKLLLQTCTVDEDLKDQAKHLIGFANGVWDAEQSKLIPNEKKFYITHYSPFHVDPNAKAPLWEQFIDEIFLSKKELIDFVQISVGYSLTGWQQQQYVWFALGGGKNGKSTFFSTFEKLFPEHCTKIDAGMLLTAKETDTSASIHKATLVGKRFVTTTEIPANLALQESTIKDLTSGERMVARRLYKDPFTFDATHKIWMGGNHMPYVPSSDWGIWRRILVIPFEYTVPDHKAKSTELMIEEFIAEAPGIIQWALNGLSRYVNLPNRKLPIPESVALASRHYRDEMDSIEMFIDEIYEPEGGLNASIPLMDMWISYQEFCKTRGFKLQSKHIRSFSAKLKEKSYFVEKDTKTNSNVVRYLKLRDLQRGERF